ncbi:hypothetical protein MYX78_05300 [Acidobacteria bacterium AH-259-G07]|nr:hypothetical protein [Acidobacteria bacterium AH-259-G07]
MLGRWYTRSGKGGISYDPTTNSGSNFICPGIFSLIAVLASHLALTDIYHGETDARLEWLALQVSFAAIIPFQISALITLGWILRARNAIRSASG